MKLKNIYKKTTKILTSPKAREFYKSAGIAAKNVGAYSQRVSNNLDKTFSIPKRLPDNTLSNRNRENPVYIIPKGYKLVKRKRR